MHKPLKASFTEVISAVADGKGFRLSAKDRRRQEQEKFIRASEQSPKKP